MITYRQTIPDDIHELSGLLSQAFHSGSVRLFDINDPVSGWVACRDGKLIGVTLADRVSRNVCIVAVAKEHRGKGIARELMRQAEAWLFSHGCEEIHVSWRDSDRIRPTSFFERLGWRKSQSELHPLRMIKRKIGGKIKLEEHRIASPDKGYSRLVRLQRGPADRPHRLCLFLDGESYWRDMDAIPMVNRLVDERKIPPMSIALVGHVSGSDRHEDYTCNESYARYIGEVVIPWLKSEVSGLEDGGHTICGLSLSGLMASYLALLYPRQFSACVSQSGSHWWRHEWFRKMAMGRRPVTCRFWMSVGDQEIDVGVRHLPTGLLQEISQIEGVRRAVQTLEGIGGVVHHRRYNGGHSLSCWRDELPEALQWVTSEANHLMMSNVH